MLGDEYFSMVYHGVFLAWYAQRVFVCFEEGVFKLVAWTWSGKILYATPPTPCTRPSYKTITTDFKTARTAVPFA